VARAVWDETAIRIRYRRWAGETETVLGPLGVVLKVGHWYLVAQVAATNELRTFRVSRLLELERLAVGFDRPPEFDLDAYWQRWSRQFETGLYQTEALIRLSPRALDFAPRILDPVPAKAIQASVGPAGSDGWREATMRIEEVDHAVMTLLRFGPEVEVMAPPQLRQAMRQMTAEMARRYEPHQSEDWTETSGAIGKLAGPEPSSWLKPTN
jgi:predicted DNA-binding transcriptional regulator YafY